MNEIEKRARELLAVEWEKDGRIFTAQSIRDNTAPVDDYDCARVIQRQRSIRAIIAALSAAPQGLPASLEQAARDALPFVAYAYAKGMDGAEEAGRAIETALGGMPEQQGEGAYHQALQQIGYALGLPAGSDLTTQCIPAIEAMRRATGRYRWLRDVHIGDEPHYINLASGPKHGLDSAIDAAMLAAKPEQQR
ncbi:hypothetical protein [Xanthomonas arboricola]|uniref:hypothetical protein n=1 Tax=Xanthomonas arboricola TaxID=56448 RepID=UPI000F8D3958|nr:hypothetical protein [Xanthomonas arboricola]